MSHKPWSIATKSERPAQPAIEVQEVHMTVDQMAEAMIARGDKLFCIMRTGDYYLNWERAGTIKLESSVNGMPNMASAVIALYHKVSPYL